MNSCDEDSSVSNTFGELELLIDRPVGQVWRQYLDFGSWATSHDIEYVCGKPDEEGSIIRTSFKKAKALNMPLPHYHFCKIIKIVPERQCLQKAYSAKGGSYGVQMVGFEEARFVPVDGKTRLHFRWYGEHRGELVVTAPEAINEANTDDHTSINFKRLKEIVEAQPRLE